MTKRTLLSLVLCCAAFVPQQAAAQPPAAQNQPAQQSSSPQSILTVPGEPSNLDDLKQQLKLYHDCAGPNCYGPQLDRQANLAIALLQQSVASARPGEKLALVLDIDETSLSNWQTILHDDFGYIHNDSDWCIALRCSTVIPATLRLYCEARKDNVAVFFITGRPEPQRADTAANLKAAGYDQWQDLYLRPVENTPGHPPGQTTSGYKSGARARIVAQGYRIVLNVGDQRSDLVGNPQADHSVKLPNPFYLIP